MKNNTLAKIFIAACMLVISNFATAQFDDTFMFRQCIDQSNVKNISDLKKPFSWEQGYCLGFIQSLRGSNEIIKEVDPSKAFCAPDEFDEFDLLKTIIKQAAMDKNLKNYPDRYELSRLALQKAYPCTKKKMSPREIFIPVFCILIALFALLILTPTRLWLKGSNDEKDSKPNDDKFIE
jgi:hypothetical protein